MMTFPRSALINSLPIYISYQEASKIEMRETATLPFWEDVLNEHMRDSVTTVNASLSLDDEISPVDAVVRYVDNNGFSSISLLVMGPKCANGQEASSSVIEKQLDDAAWQLFASSKPLTRQNFVFGAIVVGAFIRVFRFEKQFDEKTGELCIGSQAIWGGDGSTGKRWYKKAGEDCDEILKALTLIKNSRKGADPAPCRPPLSRPASEVSPARAVSSHHTTYHDGSAPSSPSAVQGPSRPSPAPAPATPSIASVPINVPPAPTVGGKLMVTFIPCPTAGFYAYELNGKVKASSKTEWRDSGTFLFNDTKNLYGPKPQWWKHMTMR